MAEDSIRLDRFLWFARLAKTRGVAQAIAEAGTLRLDGRRIERSAAPVRVGNILAFPLHLAMLGAELPTRLMKTFGIRMTKKGQ